MDKSKRNRNAGIHPSLDARGMSDKAKANKRLYDSNFEKGDEKVKDRVERNRNRKKLGLKVGDKRDASEVMVNGKKVWKKKHRSENRGSKSDQPGDKRARGGNATVIAASSVSKKKYS